VASQATIIEGAATNLSQPAQLQSISSLSFKCFDSRRELDLFSEIWKKLATVTHDSSASRLNWSALACKQREVPFIRRRRFPPRCIVSSPHEVAVTFRTISLWCCIQTKMHCDVIREILMFTGTVISCGWQEFLLNASCYVIVKVRNKKNIPVLS